MNMKSWTQNEKQKCRWLIKSTNSRFDFFSGRQLKRISVADFFLPGSFYGHFDRQPCANLTSMVTSG